MLKRIVAFSLLAACGGAQQQTATAAPVAGTPATSSSPASSAPSSATLASPAPAASPPAPATAGAVAPASAGGGAIEVPASIRAIVDATDRTEADRKLDEGRHPSELLAFAGIAPGMRVAELGAGTGYTTELLARAVAPTGKVYGQNSKFALEKFAAKPWAERLAKPVMKNVVRVDGGPFPPDAKDLDAVFVVLVYHDMVWLGVDRDKVNRAVYDMLKPGGEYVIVDHSAADGSGLRDVKTLHRIDQRAVVDEVTRAGFKVAAEGSFLRNPSDTRDWNASPMAAAERRGKSDRFVIKFVRP
jgi:predicted methyltransferase